MNCQSECDCTAPGGYPHEPDCRYHEHCEEERMCDKHRAESMAEHAWLKGTPSPEQYRQDMIDAGRAHLLPDVMADRIDMARMRAKDR